MSGYDIDQVLHPTDTDISPSGTVSREFGVPSKSVVRIEGTLTGEWDVESRRKDGTEWISESSGVWSGGSDPLEKPSSEMKQFVVQGNPNLVYRVNLLANTAGPHAFVYEVALRRYQ